MSDLTPRDLELVALGTAMGSNCASCVEYHIPKAREVGLTDQEIHAAIKHADLVRQVPARKTLQTALRLLPCATDDPLRADAGQDCGCAAIATGEASQTSDKGRGCS